MEDERLPDENLDTQEAETEAAADTSDSQEESENLDAEESKDESEESEGHDSDAAGESSPEDELTKLRKQNKNLTIALQKEREAKRDGKVESATTGDDAKPTQGSSLLKKFQENLIKTDLLQLQLDDPTAKARKPEILKIFQERPELLKMENAVQLADEIAKGRLITVQANGASAKKPTSPTTSPAPKRTQVTTPDPTKLEGKALEDWEDGQIRKKK